MKKLLVIIMTLTMVFCICACGDAEEAGDAVDETTAPEYTSYFESDELVNQFINEFVENSDFSVSDIEKGNIEEKCYCNIGECYVEIINASSDYDEEEPTLEITLNGDSQKDITDEMLAITNAMCKTVTPSLTEDMISDAIEAIKSCEYMTDGIEVGDNIVIDYLPYGLSNNHWLKMHIYNYNLK